MSRFLLVHLNENEWIFFDKKTTKEYYVVENCNKVYLHKNHMGPLLTRTSFFFEPYDEDDKDWKARQISTFEYFFDRVLAYDE